MDDRCHIPATGYPETVTEPPSNCARLAAQPLAEGGTPVELWNEWGRKFLPLDIDHCPALLLVAAHPDDETLGLGATAAMLTERGAPVQLVSVTDGEAAYPDDPGGRARLAARRREELIAAAARLRLAGPIFLGIPDGEVATNEDRLQVELEAILAESPPGTWCAAPWRGDGHPDHEATGRAAAAASHDTPAVLVEYPIWMWHWALPDDPDVPWGDVRRMPLTARSSTAKEAALRSFASQLERRDGPPLLAPEIIARQLAVGEVVFV